MLDVKVSKGMIEMWEYIVPGFIIIREVFSEIEISYLRKRIRQCCDVCHLLRYHEYTTVSDGIVVNSAQWYSYYTFITYIHVFIIGHVT